MSIFKAINATESSAELAAVRALQSNEKASWHDSAERVFDDFNQLQPVLVSENTSLKEAEQQMEAARQRYACIVNRDDKIIGLVALREFHGRRAMQLGLQAQVPWYDVPVKELMIRLSELPQITRKQLLQARIGDAAATLKQKGHDFLVVQENGTLCGVVSSLRIAQVTGESVNIYHSASTFAEIMSAVSHKDLND